MPQVLHKLQRTKIGDPDFMIFCPACKYGHAIWVTDKCPGTGGIWTWNGNMDKPTFSPSLLIEERYNMPRCHSMIEGGVIRFLPDCTHELRNQTVPLTEF